MKILSLPKHEHLTTSKKYCGKKEKLLLRSNFSSFPQYFQCISNVKSPITYKFVKCGCSNYFFLQSENLICRGTDISKCFRESLGIPDNESRLYMACKNKVCRVASPESVSISFIAPEALYERSWTGPMLFSMDSSMLYNQV